MQKRKILSQFWSRTCSGVCRNYYACVAWLFCAWSSSHYFCLSLFGVKFVMARNRNQSTKRDGCSQRSYTRDRLREEVERRGGASGASQSWGDGQTKLMRPK